jgi:hypothetical protein
VGVYHARQKSNENFKKFQVNLSHKILYLFLPFLFKASIAQLGERKTENLKAPCSIHGRSILFTQCDYDSVFDGFLQHQCQLG